MLAIFATIDTGTYIPAKAAFPKASRRNGRANVIFRGGKNRSYAFFAYGITAKTVGAVAETLIESR